MQCFVDKFYPYTIYQNISTIIQRRIIQDDSKNNVGHFYSWKQRRDRTKERKDGHITSILLVTSFSAIVFACFGEQSFIHPKWLFSTSEYTIAQLIMLVLLLLSLLIWILLCCVAKYRVSSCLSVPWNDPVSSVVCILYGLFGFGTKQFISSPLSSKLGVIKKMVSTCTRVLHVIFLCVQIISIWRFSRFHPNKKILQ